MVVGPLGAPAAAATGGATVVGDIATGVVDAVGLGPADGPAVAEGAAALRALGFFASGVSSSSFLRAASIDSFSAFCQWASNLSPIFVLRMIVSMTILAFWSA